MQPLWETKWHFLKNLKIKLRYDPAILLLNVILKKKELKTKSQVVICTLVFTGAIIHNSQKVAQVFVKGWMDTENVVYTNNGILINLINLKKG